MIRETTLEETPQLIELALRSKQYWGYTAADMTEFEHILRTSDFTGTTNIAYEHDGTIVGFYRLHIKRAGSLLLDFYIEPAHIKQGFGRQLWRHLIETAKAANLTTFLFESDPHAARFFERLGAIPYGYVRSTVRGDSKSPLYQWSIYEETPSS